MNEQARERDPEELRTASAHVYYELWMLIEVARKLDERPSDRAQRCALLESFLVHGRQLHHFLWPKNEKRDDVLARNYFPEEEWQAPPIPTVLRDPWRTDVNKYIAHISYSRPPPGQEKEWPSRDIARELLSCMHAFQGAVRSARPSLLDARWQVPLTYEPPTIRAGSVASTTATGLPPFAPTVIDGKYTILAEPDGKFSVSTATNAPAPGTTGRSAY